MQRVSTLQVGIDGVDIALGHYFLLANSITPIVKIVADLLRSSTANRRWLLLGPLLVAISLILLLTLAQNTALSVQILAQSVVIGVLASGGAFALTRLDRAADRAELETTRWQAAGLGRLRLILSQRLSSEELNGLCFDLDCPCENDVKDDLVICILSYIRKRKKEKELTAWVSSFRPDINLDGV
jgi:hypothetical protein